MTIVLGPLIVGVVVGVAIWLLGRWTAVRREKGNSIRDLMTYRGDYSTADFRRSINKVSITFHDDEKVRLQVQDLNEAINGGEVSTTSINRKIVRLIFDLCQRNGFKGITQYDIDQAFPEQKQTPEGGSPNTTPAPPEITQPVPKKADKKPDKHSDVKEAVVIYGPNEPRP